MEGTGRFGGGETGAMAGCCADVLKSFEEVLLGFTNGEGGGAVVGRSVVGAEECRGGGRRPGTEVVTGNGFWGGETHNLFEAKLNLFASPCLNLASPCFLSPLLAPANTRVGGIGNRPRLKFRKS